MISRIFTLFAAFVMLYSPINSLSASCGGCDRGECILSGVSSGVSSGISGIGGVSLDNLFTYNTVSGLALFPGGTPFTFNGPVVVHGTGVSKLNASTFLITKPGHYMVTFVASTAAASAPGGIETQLNGVSTGVNQSLLFAGAQLVLNQIIDVTTIPSSLQVVTTGLGLNLALGVSSTISIVELNSP